MPLRDSIPDRCFTIAPPHGFFRITISLFAVLVFSSVPHTILAASGLTAALPTAVERPVDFIKEIKPILDQHCASCHSADKQRGGFRIDSKAAAMKGGENHAPAIIPGDSTHSPLIQFVAGTIPDMVMPQKGERLTPGQIGMLRAWIDQGATWPDDLPGEQHWSFKQPVRPQAPQVKGRQWIRNEIDSFVLQKLEQQKLSPSKEADRRTLIRRVSFDLTGLPPTPEEVEAFASDKTPGAYERLVDRLLNSPRYGERWARHWLDVVRFAETSGFEVNTPRDNAWPYRDYVIRALNEDKPFDRFIIEQIAGDAFGVEEATGFIVGGPNDQVKSPDVVLTRQQRADELHDMVATTGSAFLGLTIGCARCHNHKFDPISQRDYYAVTAVFSGVQHGERLLKPADYETRMSQAKELRGNVARIEDALTRFEPLAAPNPAPTPKPNPRSNEERFEPVRAKFVRFTIHDTQRHPTIGEIEPCIDELEVFSAEAAPRNVALASAGAIATASSTYKGVAYHKLEHLNDGNYGNARSWIAGENGTAWVQIELPEVTTVNRIVWGRDREGTYDDRLPLHYTIETGVNGMKNGDSVIEWKRVAGTPPLRPAVHPRQNVERFPTVDAKFLRFTITETSGLEPCIDELEVYTAAPTPRNVALASQGARATASSVYPNSEIHKLEHINDGLHGNNHSWISSETGKGWVQIKFPQMVSINKVVWGRDREEKFSDRLATNYRIEVAAEDGKWKTVAGSSDRHRYVAGRRQMPLESTLFLKPAEHTEMLALVSERNKLEARIKELTAFPMVYAGTFGAPEPTYRLQRGEVMQRREEVAPGALSAFAPELKLSANAKEQERRLALAAWIASTNNPLTARVIVNRLWQHHLGEGIVNTPSDFGVNGGRPSHPELLDWLATELVRQEWKLKPIHRLILLSSTYRQSSAVNPKAIAIDAGNRFLWRFSPRRLEAEPIRDTILTVSGKLDLRMGGPGYHVFEPNDNYVRVYEPKKEYGPAEWRRMIYQFKPRMQQDITFGAFDCPDGGQIAPRRNISNTPLQALNLLNSPFIVQQANAFNERLQSEANLPEARIRRAFQLAFQREPTRQELRRSLQLVESAGLPVFCRTLFNANEFIYVF